MTWMLLGNSKTYESCECHHSRLFPIIVDQIPQ